MEPAGILCAPERIGQSRGVEEIRAGILEEAEQDAPGRADGENEGEQGNRHQHVDIGQELHPAIEAAHHREDGQRCDEGNQEDLQPERGFDPEQKTDAGSSLARPETERGRQAEQRRHHSDKINDMAGPTPDAVAEQRIEGRADRQWQALVEGEEGQRQADHAIDRPGRHAPVEDGRGHGDILGMAGARLDVQRRAENA